MARVSFSPSSIIAPAAARAAAVGRWERLRRWWRGEVTTELEEPPHGVEDDERRRRRALIAAGYTPVSSAVAVAPVAAETGGAFRIHCIPVSGVVDLPARIQAECERQKTGGLTLSSSFVHDGHAFLVFKRELPPVAGASPKFSAGST